MNRPSSYRDGTARRTTLPGRRLVFLVAGAALLAACTSTEDQANTLAPNDGTASETTVADYVVAFEEPDADDFNKLLSSEDGLEGLQVAAILHVEAISPTELLVAFEMESHLCFGLQAGVEETGSEIIIEIRTGRRPGIDPGTCAYGIYPYTTRLELDAPVGTRTITAAEAQEPPEALSVDPDPATDATNDASAGLPPVDHSADVVEPLIGEFVEDGVEWAIAKGIAWRVLSYEGVPVADTSPIDPDRISFVVVKDRIVDYEWS